MPETYDVVIVGAGIVGCAAALELARDHEVLVLERGQIGAGATSKASGLVTIVEEYSDVPVAAEYSVSFFRDLDGTGDFAFTERPFIELRSDDHDASAIRRHAADIRENGFEVAFHTPAELDERFPETFQLSGHIGGVVYEDAGWLDPYTLVMTVKDEAEAAGVEFRTGIEVEAVAIEDGRVVGVETTAGDRIGGEQVVAAAGWRTRDLVSEYVELPVRPFRYQTTNLDHGRTFTEDFPMAWDERSHLYWRPEHNGELHVGGGTYFVDPPGEVRTTTTEGFQRLVAETIPERIVGLEDARFIGGDTCRTGDAATPDRYPIIDAPAEAPDGLVVATGGHGFGIMASPAAGRAVRAVVADDPGPFPVDQFALDRFADRSTDFGSSYIVESPDEIGPEH